MRWFEPCLIANHLRPKELSWGVTATLMTTERQRPQRNQTRRRNPLRKGGGAATYLKTRRHSAAQRAQERTARLHSGRSNRAYSFAAASHTSATSAQA